MIVYHGSTVAVENPEIRRGESFLDFGTGFYTTSSYEQAERWAKIKMRRSNVKTGYVTVYDFDYESANKLLEVYTFKSADEEWLRFVTDNRSGKQSYLFADIYVGPVADDNVYSTIRLFETGILDSEETIKWLKTEVLQDQWAFHNEKALGFLTHIDTIKIGETNNG